MRNYEIEKGLYTLRINKVRLAYELTDCAIIISAIIQPNVLQNQRNAARIILCHQLINQYFPNLIKQLFKITPLCLSKQLTENQIECSITINPIDNANNTTDRNGSAIKKIKRIHRKLIEELTQRFDGFEIRWLGCLELPESAQLSM